VVLFFDAASNEINIPVDTIELDVHDLKRGVYLIKYLIIVAFFLLSLLRNIIANN
jgi:hypothetical protein|tara:strand:- start:187 stop:351 length:165 start_codon:yes stop_codon:yes gene_type:complete